MAYCKFCGNELEDDAVFCASCGKKTLSQADETLTEKKKTNDFVKESNSKPRGNKRAVISICIILALVIITFNSCAHSGRKQQMINNAKIDYQNSGPYDHVDDYKGLCIIRIGGEGSHLYYTYHDGHIYTAGSIAAMRDLLDKKID